MPTWGLFAVSNANTGEPINKWIASIDVDARDGRGLATFTDNPARALLFSNAPAALLTWKTQSVVRPLRADGKPNRPLTAFTCEVRPTPTAGPARRLT